MGEAAEDGFGGGGAGVAEDVEGEGGVALGEALAGVVAEEGDVGEARCAVAEETVEVGLLGGGKEEVVATDYFGDAHVGIVDYDCKLVGPRAVGTPEDEVTAFAGKVVGVGTHEEVVECDVGILYHQTGGWLATCGKPVRSEAGGVLVRKGAAGVAVRGAAGAGVDYAAIALVGGLGGHYVGAGAVAGICEAGGLEASEGFGVQVVATALIVRAFVPGQAKPFKV